MQNILIIGSDSTIGAHLKKELESAGELVYGTTRHQSRCNKTIFFLDLLNPDVFNIPDYATIGTVIFCASMSKIKECEENKAVSYQINVEANLKLAHYLKNKFNPFMIFLSSNAVFDGSKPFFLETDQPCPINYYGYCKAEAEKKLAGITDKLAILRLTKVLHPEQPLIKKWIHELKNKKSIYPFDNLKLAPISLNNASEAIKKILSLQKLGVFHVSGNQDITYFELATMLAKKIKHKPPIIIPSTSHYQSAALYNSLDTTHSRKYLNTSEIESNTIIDLIL